MKLGDILLLAFSDPTKRFYRYTDSENIYKINGLSSSIRVDDHGKTIGGGFSHEPDDDVVQVECTYELLNSIDPSDLINVDDPSKEALFFLAHTNYNRKKNVLLNQLNDTMYSMTMELCQQLLKELGFQLLYTDVFASKSRGAGATDSYNIYWNPAGLLLELESFGQYVNTIEVYFNMLITDESYYPSGSGHFIRRDQGLIFVGKVDARSGFKYWLTTVKAYSRFLPVWIERPHLWLLTYEQSRSLDSKTHTHAEILAKSKEYTDAVLARLPDYVLKAISPDETQGALS